MCLALPARVVALTGADQAQIDLGGVKKTVSKNKKVAHDEVERLWDGVVSGSQPDCVSDYGVHDMPGNADELASSETPPPRSKFDNVTTVSFGAVVDNNGFFGTTSGGNNDTCAAEVDVSGCDTVIAASADDTTRVQTALIEPCHIMPGEIGLAPTGD